jgi:hypothetical protein
MKNKSKILGFVPEDHVEANFREDGRKKRN